MGRKFFTPLLISCLLIGVLGAALGQQQPPQLPKPNPEDLKHGAILCTWMIVLGAKYVGETCYPNKDATFQAVLEKEIARIDQFIMTNAPMTKEQVERLKQNPTFHPQGALLCRPDLRHLYEVLRQAGPQKLNTNVTDLLSVPRKPVLNPCL